MRCRVRGLCSTEVFGCQAGAPDSTVLLLSIVGVQYIVLLQLYPK